MWDGFVELGLHGLHASGWPGVCALVQGDTGGAEQGNRCVRGAQQSSGRDRDPGKGLVQTLCGKGRCPGVFLLPSLCSEDLPHGLCALPQGVRGDHGCSSGRHRPAGVREGGAEAAPEQPVQENHRGPARGSCLRGCLHRVRHCRRCVTTESFPAAVGWGQRAGGRGAGAVQGNAPCTGSSAALLPNLSSGNHSPGGGQDGERTGGVWDLMVMSGACRQPAAPGSALQLHVGAALWSWLGPSSPQGAPGGMQGSVPACWQVLPAARSACLRAAAPQDTGGLCCPPGLVDVSQFPLKPPARGG